MDFLNYFNFAKPLNHGVISKEKSHIFVKSFEHGMLTGSNCLFNTFANEVNITIGSLFYFAGLHTFNDNTVRPTLNVTVTVTDALQYNDMLFAFIVAVTQIN